MRKNSLRLGFAGDLSLSVLKRPEFGGMQQLVDQCRPFTTEVDFAIANLESVIIPSRRKSLPKMAISVEQCPRLEDLGFDLFSLANNHILDCGDDGLTFTQSFLHERGLRTVGAGANRRNAEAPLTLTLAGKSLAFFSVTDASHYGATRRSSGVAPLARRKLIRSINKLKSRVDLLVVSIHSDLEFMNVPAPWKVRFSRRLVREGADIVIHHHPHTLQGIERYRGGLIAYSLGNFIFPVYGNTYMKGKAGHPAETVFLTADIRWYAASARAIEYAIVPAVIDEANRLRCASTKEANTIRNRMDTYSEYLRDPSILRKEFFRACAQHGRRFIFGLYYECRREGLRAAWRYFRLHFSTDMHRNWMRGLITFGKL